MNKSFEEEYKALAQSKLPDLWDRIEAGLSEKKPVSVPITINEENKRKNTVLPAKTRRQKRRRIQLEKNTKKTPQMDKKEKQRSKRLLP